jgi:hypothetical protein
MSLPKIDVPIYEVELPLSKKVVKIRPFLVKEEKILMMALESDDDDAILFAIKQIANNCCIESIDIEEMPIIDLEFLFLQLRARSVGEIIDLQYVCNNNVIDEETKDEKKCGNIVKLEFNALEIKPEVDEPHDKKIQITDKLGVVMKYPDFKLAEKIKNLNETETIVKTIVNCIDYIYDEENIYYSKDVKEIELENFIDSLTSEQFKKIEKFFETIPKISKELDFKCNRCGYEEKVFLDGIQSFFV